MNKTLTERMRKVRQLRLEGKTLQQIGDIIGTTRQGVRHILVSADKFCDLKLGSYEEYKKHAERNKSV